MLCWHQAALDPHALNRHSVVSEMRYPPHRLKMACLPLLLACVACVASSLTLIAVRALMGNTCTQLHMLKNYAVAVQSTGASDLEASPAVFYHVS